MHFGQAHTSFIPSDSSPKAILGLLTRPHCVGRTGRAACQFRKGGAALGRPKSLSAAVQQNCRCHHIPAQASKCKTATSFRKRVSEGGRQASAQGRKPLRGAWSPRIGSRGPPQEEAPHSCQFLQSLEKPSCHRTFCGVLSLLHSGEPLFPLLCLFPDFHTKPPHRSLVCMED